MPNKASPQSIIKLIFQKQFKNRNQEAPKMNRIEKRGTGKIDEKRGTGKIDYSSLSDTDEQDRTAEINITWFYFY